MSRYTNQDLADVIRECLAAGIRHLDVAMTVKAALDGGKLSPAAVEAHVLTLRGRILRGERGL